MDVPAVKSPTLYKPYDQLSASSYAGESQIIELVEDTGRQSPFPLVQCRNICIMPGVPELLQRKWRTLKVGPLLHGKCIRPNASIANSV